LGAERPGNYAYKLPRLDAEFFPDSGDGDDALLEKECQLYLREKGFNFFLLRFRQDGTCDLTLPRTDAIDANTPLECYMKAVLES
jgi:hypothetical protein